VRTERFKGALLSTLVIASLMVPAIPLLSVSPSFAALEGLTPRAPIYIYGNDNFIPANGVVGGSGMENDPYIIENWDISAGGAHGIWIISTTAYFIIRNCRVEDGGSNYGGIYLYGVMNGRIENNTCENNLRGIYLYRSDNIKMRNNILSNNQYNFGVEGSDHSHFVHDIDTSNLVNGKPIHYLVDNHNEVISPSLNVGYLALVGCENVWVEDFALENNWQGILIAFTDNSRVENCVFTNNRNGIGFTHSFYNIFENNIFTNDGVGIGFGSYSSNNIISNNTFYNGGGIHLGLSDNNIISSNICENNGDSIAVGWSNNNTISNNICSKNLYAGIYTYGYSSNNIIENNTCENNNQGIELGDSDNNTLSNNTISNNNYGIYLHGSDNNLIYHNNFINNTNQAHDDGTNYWDNGYPWGGNYWSDYTGEDNYRGENQNKPGSDLIGDTPYDTPGDNNLDRYPLMNPSPLWTGWARVFLPPIYVIMIYPPPCLYAVALETNLALYQGSKLVIKFYTWWDTFQAESVMWSGQTPAHVVLLGSIWHPKGEPTEKARLDLTTDNTENVISTIANFTLRRSDLIRLISAIKGRWDLAPPEEKRDCIKTLSVIKGLWELAPS